MSKLKRLVAVRHCKDWNDDELSPEGIEQAKNLACLIREILADINDSIVLSSPPGRATTTANLIAEQLRSKVFVVNELELDYYCHGAEQVKAIESFLEEHEGIVVINHFEAPSGIMNALSRKFFGKTYESVDVRKGTGFVFDGVLGEVKQVP
jgi:broad specificity phosphatase PhoE